MGNLLNGVQRVARTARIWTPSKDPLELFADVSPQEAVFSTVQHMLHAIVQQQGSVTFGYGEPNRGTLCWETVHREIPGLPPEQWPMETTVWVQQED